ncbi:MAG TPA: hypothetical protein VHZ96_26465 [Frankiaceae bacterium]|jgi:hypothetical protein|nr:hypothetical protein [Frankiaceae bacterium]
MTDLKPIERPTWPPCPYCSGEVEVEAMPYYDSAYISVDCRSCGASWDERGLPQNGPTLMVPMT